jgi:hypothetical protein
MCWLLPKKLDQRVYAFKNSRKGVYNLPASSSPTFYLLVQLWSLGYSKSLLPQSHVGGSLLSSSSFFERLANPLDVIFGTVEYYREQDIAEPLWQH